MRRITDWQTWKGKDEMRGGMTRAESSLNPHVFSRDSATELKTSLADGESGVRSTKSQQTSWMVASPAPTLTNLHSMYQSVRLLLAVRRQCGRRRVGRRVRSLRSSYICDAPNAVQTTRERTQRTLSRLRICALCYASATCTRTRRMPNRPDFTEGVN